MQPKPTDARTVTRMYAARDRACAALHATPGPPAGRGGVDDAWGFAGRSLGAAVTASHGPGWLRITATETGTRVATFWDGARAAQRTLPPSIPRPALRAVHDHTHQGWEYRAELYDRVDRPVLADIRAPSRLDSRPDDRWFSALQTTLQILGAVRTTRRTVEQPHLDRILPRLLGEPITTAAPAAWTTAHGDLHWANLCGPELRLLDWEGWGLAPVGYDIATLHCHSLLMPPTAAQIHQHFRSVLATPSGRYAELAVIAELLDAACRGAIRCDLVPHLRARAADLLQRPVPQQPDQP